MSHRRLKTLEEQFVEQLILALKHCAGGHWGLFGQNDRAIGQISQNQAARLRHPAVQDLIDLGQEITEMRSKLGIFDVFLPYHRLMEMRLSQNANSASEPKLAKQWLENL